MKFLFILLGFLCLQITASHAQELPKNDISFQRSLTRIYIPSIDEMKYKYMSASVGLGFFFNPKTDDLETVGIAKLSFPYIAKRVSLELSIGYVLTSQGSVGLFGLGANTRIKDWMVIKSERENASLLRLSVENAFVRTPNPDIQSSVAVISRLKHQINLELLVYKRSMSFYFGMGLITSPYENFNYGSSALATEAGIRFCSSHFSKGALFERNSSEIYEIPIREK